jgi:phage-related protein
MVAIDRVTEAGVIRITEQKGVFVPDPLPRWEWCPMPGMGATTTMAVDTNAYGDGYIHRSTRGLNPARSAWTLTFPFTSQADFAAMCAFLAAYAVPGFWIRPPDSIAWAFVTADAWSWTVSDRVGPERDIGGTLQATFNQSFNPQPIPMPT